MTPCVPRHPHVDTRSSVEVLGVRLAVVGLVLALAACATRPLTGPIPGSIQVAPAPEESYGVQSDEPYRIQSGDELEIRFFHTPERDVVMPVRPDGCISVPLAHELRAAGRTVEELRLDLVERCSHELARPEITVIVRTFSGYPVHVGGEVNKPGVLELGGPRTVLQAVFEAGGFLPTASPADVLVVRRGEQGRFEIVTTDLERVLEGQDASGNILLRPYDVVYVPSSRIAEVNKWVDQYIRRNIPIQFSYRLEGL